MMIRIDLAGLRRTKWHDYARQGLLTAGIARDKVYITNVVKDLTACLKVAGDYILELKFLAVLLGVDQLKGIAAWPE